MMCWCLDHVRRSLHSQGRQIKNIPGKRRSKMLRLNTINPAITHDENHFKQRMEAVDTQKRSLITLKLVLFWSRLETANYDRGLDK